MRSLLLCILFVACNSNALKNGVLECGTGAVCPSGFHCAIDNFCWQDGSGPDLSAALSDGGGSDDGGSFDLSGPCGAIGGACCTTGNACTAADSCCGAGICRRSYSAAVTADNPVAYWRFEGQNSTNVFPTAGTTAGVLRGGVTHVAGALTCGGFAVSLDGTSGYLDFGRAAAADFGASDFSIEFWANVRTFSASSFSYFFSKRDACSFGDFWNLPVNATTAVMELDNEDNGHVYGANTWSSAVANDTKWHHYVFTRAGVTNSFYLDGVLQSAIASSTATAPVDLHNMAKFTTGLVLDNCANQASTFFPGSIDELALYHTPLTANQVGAHFSAR